LDFCDLKLFGNRVEAVTTCCSAEARMVRKTEKEKTNTAIRGTKIAPILN
jgi:hypothetical protein